MLEKSLSEKTESLNTSKDAPCQEPKPGDNNESVEYCCSSNNTPNVLAPASSYHKLSGSATLPAFCTNSLKGPDHERRKVLVTHQFLKGTLPGYYEYELSTPLSDGRWSIEPWFPFRTNTQG
jgi:hypothetical protein